MPASTHDVLVIGASAFDIKTRIHTQPETGSPVPGVIRVQVGGTARNIAENLARLEMSVALFSAVGAHDFGPHLVERTAQAGVDVSQVLVSPEFRTAAYLAVLNNRGEPEWSIDDMGVLYLLSPAYIQERRVWFRNARAVIVDANLPPPTLQVIAELCRRHNIMLCADPTSTILAPRLLPHLRDIWILTPNVAEAEVLCGHPIHNDDEALAAARELVARGVRMVVVTLGGDGLVYATRRESGRVPALGVDVVDITGVGDAFTAGLVFGLLNDFPVDEAVRLGASAAALTMRSTETVTPDLSLEQLYDHLVV
nr:carbohydrate kinase family protein [Ardenticatena sp.]